MRKTRVVIIVLCFVTISMCLLSVAIAENIAVGTLGTLRWKIDSEGVLTISGNGAIQNFGYNAGGAWNDYKSSITVVIIQDGVTSIGENAFFGCGNLKSATIPESVTKIGGWSFENCSSLLNVTIPETVENIGTCAFFGCSSLTSVTIPKNLTKLGDGTFRSCTSLIEISVAADNANYCDVNGVLFDKNITKLIQYPLGRTETYEIPSSVNSIESYAFFGCDGLTSIIIPSNVTSIGGSAFSKCSNLESIKIPSSVTSIGGAFSSCPKLKTAGPIGSGCNYEFGWTNSIPSSAFSSTSLTNIIIPEGVTSIGTNALSYCSSLKSITIPVSVTNIGYEAFYQSNSLTDIYYQGTVLQWEKISISSENNPLSKATLHCADASGFCGDEIVWSLDHNGVLNISGSGTMYDYSVYSPSPWYNNKLVTSITISEGVITIGESAFDSCSNLTNVTIPVTTTSIGDWAFYECNNLVEVYYGGSTKQWQKVTIDSVSNAPLISATLHCAPTFTITINESINGHISVDNTSPAEGDLVSLIIEPDSCYGLDSLTVMCGESSVEISNNSFTMPSGNVDITATFIMNNHTLSLHEAIPATCLATGIDAYWSCDVCGRLFSDEEGKNEIEEPIELPKTSHVWGEASYFWSPDNRSITATHVCNIDNSHKEEITVGVTAVIISPTERTRGSAAYTSEAFNAEGFTVQRKSIAIPMLRNMSVLYLPNLLTTIEDEAFAGIDCEAIVIPTGCTSVGKHAFENCENLLYVKVPANTTIEPDAFDGCEDVVVDVVTE